MEDGLYGFNLITLSSVSVRSDVSLYFIGQTADIAFYDVKGTVQPFFALFFLSIEEIIDIVMFHHRIPKPTVLCPTVVPYDKGSQTFQAMTPKIIIFEVGTPLYLFDSIPQINIVKIADLQARAKR